MCGLTGGLSPRGFELLQGALPRMVDALVPRGPDDGGYWSDRDAGIALGHRRLAVVDLSPAGHQPMVSASGRWVIVYNGEIYNHLDIRNELAAKKDAAAWGGHADTETLLAGFDAWGVRATVERCVGMFAFAVWDRSERVLTLCRDRMGEKPLYYGWQGGGAEACFLFGSELASLKRHPVFSATLNREALGLFMRHTYVPAPHSIYEGIFKLPPGHLLSVSASRPEPVLEQYWSIAKVAKDGAANPFDGSAADVTNALETLLTGAIGQQMMADVPLGAFLSGGVDSSTVVALMQAQSGRPVRTFSMGFSEVEYNEAVYAKAVAAHLGTDHTDMYVTPREALDVIPKLPSIYSEPFADSSQIPMYLVSALARQHVTVALSGDGGDELFCGYQRYAFAQAVWRKISRAPQTIRAMVGRGIMAIPPDGWNFLLAPIQLAIKGRMRNANLGDKFHKGAGLLGAEDLDRLYYRLVSSWRNEQPVLGLSRPPDSLFSSEPLEGLGELERMMAFDMATYLPDDILTKVDRAAMSVSLESRVPLLDHRVVEFAWRIPQSLKVADGETKWALRQVLYRHVPKELIDRPKAGFSVPLAQWLRGPLREWAEDLLDETRLRNEGFFNPQLIRNKWCEHVSGRRNWHHHLWSVLMFQAWYSEHQVPTLPCADRGVGWK